MFVFREIWCALFSCNSRFEIRPFALLPKTYARKKLQTKKSYRGPLNQLVVPNQKLSEIMSKLFKKTLRRVSYQ